jgi:RimJ/RimL family protein N-acetyltransferase
VLEVRPATADDADAIARIHVESWRAAYTGLIPEEAVTAFDVAARRRMWREALEGTRPAGCATFVAELDGVVVGVANVVPARGEPGGLGEVTHIYLHPSAWGQGIGRDLMLRAEKSLRESGFDEAVLWVLEGNERAERFYRTAGWKADGDRKLDDFAGPPLPELRYRKRL